MSRKKNWPSWLKKRIYLTDNNEYTQQTINNLKLNTVCLSAHCPNLSECFSQKQVTFLILGNSCTRSCRFCAIKNDIPQAVDEYEPERIAQAVKKLRLRYVIVTSVTRDDLADGGATQFSKTITEVRRINSKVKIEVLVPDFQGLEEAVKIILESKPDVFNHNIETVPRLYRRIRPQAQYQRSLNVLDMAKRINQKAITKSGLMLGLGEKEDEVLRVFEDLVRINCAVLTLGQYLKPTNSKTEIKKFINPEQFERYARRAKQIGFKYVFSGPWVRSSYYAQAIFKKILN